MSASVPAFLVLDGVFNNKNGVWHSAPVLTDTVYFDHYQEFTQSVASVTVDPF